MKVDVHTHILPPEIPKWKDKFGYGGFMCLEKTGCSAKMLKDDGTFFRDVKSNLWDPDVRAKECAEMGVTVQVLSTVPVLFAYWAKPKDGLEICRYLNDHVAETVAKKPFQFKGLGTIPMQDPELAIDELERCIKDLKLSGVQIGSHVNGKNFDDPAIIGVLAAASRLGAAVFVHPWEMLGGDRLQKHWFPWLIGMPTETALAIASLIFGGALEKLPKLRIGFAHGGGAFPFILGRLDHGFHSRPDLCQTQNKVPPSAYAGRFFVDSLVHDPRALRYLIEIVGENRVMLGSDYPFPLGEEKPGRLIESLGDASLANRLCVENALEFLGSGS